MWVEEELKPGNLSNGTVMSYVGTVARIKKHPIAQRKLKTVTADHLQAYMDLLSFGGKNPDGTTAKALSKGYIRLFSAVLQGAFDHMKHEWILKFLNYYIKDKNILWLVNKYLKIPTCGSVPNSV